MPLLPALQVLSPLLFPGIYRYCRNMYFTNQPEPHHQHQNQGAGHYRHSKSSLGRSRFFHNGSPYMLLLRFARCLNCNPEIPAMQMIFLTPSTMFYLIGITKTCGRENNYEHVFSHKKSMTRTVCNRKDWGERTTTCVLTGVN